MTHVKEEELMDNEGKDAFSYSQSAAPVSQTEDGELSASSKKEKPFPYSCTISELVLVDGSIKKHQEKRLALIESHASLFHAVHLIAKSYKRTAEHGKGRVLGIKELHHTSLGSPEKEDVVKEDLAPLKDTRKDKGTPMHVHSKHLLTSKSKSVIFRMQQKQDLEELPPASLIPYVVLIKNCVSLPVSTIQKRCLSGEILCRMEFFTVRCRSPPESAELRVPKLPIVREVKYVTFDSLKDLQWKLFKGFLKRKPKTIGVWREPTYSSGIEGVSAPRDVDYILPLMPKDWIIDSSLGFSEEMRHLLLRKESNA